MNFFLPRVNLTESRSGITGMEFPILNYTAAIFYKIFGFNEIWFRLTMLILFTLGLLSAYKLSFKITGSDFTAVIPPLILLASPVVTFYAASFIPDIAALALLLTGWLCFFEYIKVPSGKKLLLLTFCFTLASLVKITALISVVTLFFIVFLNQFWAEPASRQSKSHNKLLWAVIIAVISTVTWYRYASWLSIREGSGVFLMKLNHPDSFGEVRNVLSEIRKVWLPFYYHSFLEWVILLTFIFPLIFYKKVNRLLFLLTYGHWAGNFIFFFLMMEQFKQHDYYIITLLIALFFQALLNIELIVKFSNTIQRISYVAMLALLGIGMKFNREHQEFRYNPECWLYNWQKFIDYTTVETYVKQLGINRYTKVISLCDDSPDIALYYLNLKGWSPGMDFSTDRMKEIMGYKPEYLITNDSSKATLPVFSNALDYYGRYKSIYFFRLKNK